LAGLGRKEFNSGDILLASEVQGYLQDQAVMVFDDAAARGSAIPSPSEGMLTYNKDTDQLELYDGAAFGPVGSDAGLVHINTTSFSAVVSQSVNNVFTSDYKNYKIVTNFSSSIAGGIGLRYRVAGVDALTNYFATVIHQRTSGVTITSTFGNPGTFFQYNISAINIKAPSIIEIFEPQVNTTTNAIVNGLATDATSPFTSVGMCRHATSESYDGFTLLPNGGTITGSVSVYAYKD
jgi:hypothetical protein